MFCPNCGTEIQTNALFCGNCGFRVEDINLGTTTTTVETPVAEPVAEEPVINFDTPAPAAPEAPSFDFSQPVGQTPVQPTPVIQPTQPAPAPNQQYNQYQANQQQYNQYQNNQYQASQQFQAIDDNSTLMTVTKVFLIIGCVINGICGLLIPLAWCIPMTVIICKKFKNHEPIGMGLKICTLLFVSLISGICLLCMKDDRI